MGLAIGLSHLVCPFEFPLKMPSMSLPWQGGGVLQTSCLLEASRKGGWGYIAYREPATGIRNPETRNFSKETQK